MCDFERCAYKTLDVNRARFVKHTRDLFSLIYLTSDNAREYYFDLSVICGCSRSLVANDRALNALWIPHALIGWLLKRKMYTHSGRRADCGRHRQVSPVKTFLHDGTLSITVTVETMHIMHCPQSTTEHPCTQWRSLEWDFIFTLQYHTIVFHFTDCCYTSIK